MGRAIGDELRQALERLYEDERVRSDLTDDEANVLLDWGRARIESAARLAEQERRGESLSVIATRLRDMLRRISRLASQSNRLSDSEFEAALTNLVSAAGDSALSPAALSVLNERGALDRRALVSRLVEVAESSSSKGDSALA